MTIRPHVDCSIIHFGEWQIGSYRTTDFQVRRKARRAKMSVVQHVNFYLPLALVLFFARSNVVAQSFEPDTDESKSQLVIDGFTEPYRDIRIGSPDTAAITEIRVDEGDSVRYGQVIAKLDDVLVRASMNIARAASLSTGELETANLQVQTNRHKYESVLDLQKRNHATDQEVWSAKALLDESLSRAKAYEEMASRRRLELVQAEAHLQKITILAPIDGVIVERCKDVGELVSPADPHVLRIVQLDPLRISATASISQVRLLKSGQDLKVTIGSQSRIATVEFVSPIVDPSSGTAIVQLRVPNPDQQISSGMPRQIALIPEEPTAPTESNSGPKVPRQTFLKFLFLDETFR